LEGSSIVIIKNPIEDAAIPPGTLNQAGIMAVATSRAWDAKQGSNPIYLSSNSYFRMVGSIQSSPEKGRRMGSQGKEELSASCNACIGLCYPMDY
jgi:hypothetical protein